MKIKKTLIVLILFLICFLNAEVIDVNTARNIAETRFMELPGKDHQISQADIIFQESMKLAYVFHLNPAGFILISANTELPPVLAYSEKNNFPVDNEDSKILDIIKYDLTLRLENYHILPQALIDKREMEWKRYLQNNFVLQRNRDQWPPAGSTPTGGWLEENWTQNAPYNNFCPIDPVTHVRSIAGCPAVAMAMIMNYHKQTNDTQFSDADDYYHSYAGRQFWIDDDFEENGFPSFPQMNGYLDTLNQHYSGGTPLTNEDKAVLCFASGVAAQQVYTSTISGTFGVSQAYQAYERFAFDTIELLYENSPNLYDRISQNMMEGYPAHLAVVDPAGTMGHNLVIDGYNTDNYFHLNFGWGGSYNGWYLLPDEIPYGLTVIEGVIVDINLNNFNPPQNFHVADSTGLATWDPPVPSPNTFIGYNLYLDNMLVVVNLTELQYVYQGLVSGEIYTAGIEAVYNDGISIMIEYTFIYNYNPVIAPPYNFTATLIDYNDVNLTWNAPGESEIAYHSGYDNSGIGTGGAVDLICAARFTADELADYYDDWILTNVNIFLHSMDFSYVGIQVYEGGSFGDPGTLIYEEDITAIAVAEDWTNHQLSSPIPLVSGNEYWLAYDISVTSDHPAAVDAGPMVPDKGAWMYFNGTWDLLTNLGATLDYNWVITGVVTENDDTTSHASTTAIGKQHKVKTNKPFTSVFNRSVTHEPQRISRALAGYYIYRDGVQIADIADPAVSEYIDAALDAGTYEYHAVAYYTYPNGQSEPTTPCVITVTLPAPVNVCAFPQGPYLLIEWDDPEVPTRDLDSFNLYIDDEIHADNITNNFYVLNNINQFGTGYHEGYITAVYDGGYESGPSETFWWTNPSSSDDILSIEKNLFQNSPNPFNPSTTITFSLTAKDAKNAKLEIFNLKGQKVKTLECIRQLPDAKVTESLSHSVIWNGIDSNGKPVPSGVYFYRLQAGDYEQTKKMLLLK